MLQFKDLPLNERCKLVRIMNRKLVKEIAAEAGVTSGSISSFESGKVMHPDYRVIKAYEKVCGEKVD